MTTTPQHFAPRDRVVIRSYDYAADQTHPVRFGATGTYLCGLENPIYPHKVCADGREQHLLLRDDEIAPAPIERAPEGLEFAEVSAAKNIAYDALERFADEKMDVESSGFDPIELADSIVEDLLKAGVVFPEGLVDPHRVSSDEAGD